MNSIIWSFSPLDAILLITILICDLLTHLYLSKRMDVLSKRIDLIEERLRWTDCAWKR